jgi:hypothetical protein
MFKRRRQKTSRPKRPLAVTLIAAAMVVLFFARLYRALMPLIEREFFRGGLVGPFYAGFRLTEPGWVLLTSAFYLLLVIGLILTLIGFLRLRRWSWVVLMVWTGLSLTYALAQYFYGQPNYLVLASDTIIALALSQSEVQEIFGIRAKAPEPAR